VPVLEHGVPPVPAGLRLAGEEQAVRGGEQLGGVARRRLQQTGLLVRVARGGREVGGAEREKDGRPERREARPPQEIPRAGERVRVSGRRGDGRRRGLGQMIGVVLACRRGRRRRGQREGGPEHENQPSCRAESPSLLNLRRTARSSPAEPVIRSAMRAKSPSHSW
jgi:hypothetical protein